MQIFKNTNKIKTLWVYRKDILSYNHRVPWWGIMVTIFKIILTLSMTMGNADDQTILTAITTFI